MTLKKQKGEREREREEGSTTHTPSLSAQCPASTTATRNRGGNHSQGDTHQHSRAIEWEEAAKLLSNLLESHTYTPTSQLTHTLAVIKELMTRGTRRMSQVRRVNDWQTWGGGEAAAEASLEQITQLLEQMNQGNKGTPMEEKPSRQARHHIQRLLRETLTLTQQAAEAHEVVIEAPQWSQPPLPPHRLPPQDHPHHLAMTPAAAAAAPAAAEDKQKGESPQPSPAHPADVIGLAAGAQEDHKGREPTKGEPAHIIKARNILTQLVPFLVQEEAHLAAQAAYALDEWLAEQWGAPIVLLETQQEEEGPTPKPGPTEGEEPNTPDTIPWAPQTPPSYRPPATHPLTPHLTTHLPDPHSPHEPPQLETAEREPTEEYPSSPDPEEPAPRKRQTEGERALQRRDHRLPEQRRRRTVGGHELHRHRHRVPEGDYDSRRRRTHEGASSD